MEAGGGGNLRGRVFEPAEQGRAKETRTTKGLQENVG